MTKVLERNTNTLDDFITKYRDEFDYYLFEKMITNLIIENRFSLIVKGRQMHITTLLACYAAWRILQGKDIIYASFKCHLSNHFIMLVKLYLDRVGVEYDIENKRRLKIIDGGQVVSISTSTGSKGYECDDLIIDTASHIDNLQELFSATLPTLKTKGKCIIASTPNGKGDFFHKLWEESRIGKNKFQSVRVTFEDNPRYDEDWLENMKRYMNMNQRMIDQEIYAKFLDPSPKKKRKKNNKNNLIQFRVNDDLYRKVCEKLIEKDISISQYMRELLLKDVDH